MEVLPCSEARHVGESGCPEQESGGAPNSLQDAELAIESRVTEGSQFIFDGSNGDDTYYEFDFDGQILSSFSHESEDNNLGKRDHFAESGLVLENSQLGLDHTTENELPDDNMVQDGPQAVWVKWRGKWQSGIRCARVDWPLSTLRAKPTHDRKQYLVIFFPRTRNYSWADVLLVRPINEFPLPIACKTHEVGVKMVKDLTLARRFIMQKLAVGMLNILDQLNREALVDTARDVMVLKDFAVEASRCKDYSDLGRMLSKLQNMILHRYLNQDWLHQSLHSWNQRCEDANTAESIEMLKEEFSDSILWNEVNSLTNDPGPEWRSWKHEVMKWFAVSNPGPANLGPDQPIIDDGPLPAGPSTTNKRAKLEVRRADTHSASTSHHPPVPIETDFFSNYEIVSSALFDSGAVSKNGAVEDVNNKWNNLVVEPSNLEEAVTVTPRPFDSVNHNRQCMAFIESKGRQCVRYASEGDTYCCVHLSYRFVANSAKRAEITTPTTPVDLPMCGGTTVLGTKCKHRALVGSSFCKKHRPRDGEYLDSLLTNNYTINSTNNNNNKLKRKSDENLKHLESIVSTTREDELSACQDQLFVNIPEPAQQADVSDKIAQCVGSSGPEDADGPCLESPKRHSLYCEKHIPNWLRRARNGKSRIVSKEVFLELLRNCPSREQKLLLHQACELFYRLFKGILSLRNPIPKEVQFQWAVAEASKDTRVGRYLTKLVVREKERLKRLWGFEENLNLQYFSAVDESVSIPVKTVNNNSNDDREKNIIRCKICSQDFLDDRALGQHWTDSHKKEAQWLFRGYVCAICLDSFTNRKVLEAHVQERHHVQFVEQCMLLQCISCGSHFGNPDELWLHVLSIHPSSLSLLNEPHPQKVEPTKVGPVENSSPNNQSANRRFVCRFCGLKFDLLPDLGRHHQAAHMGQHTSTSLGRTKKGIEYYARKLKSGRRFKKTLNSVSYKIRNRSMQNLKKRIQASNSVGLGPVEVRVQPTVPEPTTILGRLADSQCSSVAKIFSSEIKKTKARPNNLEILSVATSACCKVSLHASLEAKYGILPERLYLKAAKLCSEQNTSIEWHQDGFICPRGCTPGVRPPILSPLEPSSVNSFGKVGSFFQSKNLTASEWTMDECHCVIDSRYFSMDLSEKNVVLCDDISFGLESVPVACVVDEVLLNAEGVDGQVEFSFPWESFTYVTKPVLDKSVLPETESLQLGCACAPSTCTSGACDHVYLFDNDYEDAKDIHGKLMHGRFSYDERGRIILEEGYLVYECNQRCRCTKSCRNRVLQNGVKLKLEVFKTERKGWAVRTRQAILRGAFVCEYIGEVIDENEANERRNRYGEEGCGYFYEIDAHINDMSRLIEGQVPYVIDATNYGNISRYINHSCSPNLVNHQVLVESMDTQLAHVGLYASRDHEIGSG
ncbi:Histone-lysine N-methyltransferase SUVR5 [Striga hermonthica]|uniref:Histone-lysine N-methyltransferase SUVR5 n=1 Tax=Striga hermonthica TaxID=68872 RepID=A0A9N7RT78_STRHE|nr:Histone-lysine N-methyltransferase SUVR5 [Striga hermonthica]